MAKVMLISRTDWGATEPRIRTKLRGTAKRVVIHHTAMETCANLQDCITQVLRIQRMHMEDRSFDDIGYNFLVGQNGTVFEGRGWELMGAHAKGHNQDSIGIAFIGNFNRDTPTFAAVSAVKWLLQDGVSRGCLCSNYSVLGHRDVGNTNCPGDKLYAEIHKLHREQSH